MVVIGTSRLLISKSSAETLDFKSRREITIRPDAIVLTVDAGIPNATFMTVFKFNKDITVGMIFATQVTTTYAIPCIHNVFQNTFDDGIFRRPIIVKASANIS